MLDGKWDVLHNWLTSGSLSIYMFIYLYIDICWKIRSTYLNVHIYNIFYTKKYMFENMYTKSTQEKMIEIIRLDVFFLVKIKSSRIDGTIVYLHP